MKPQTEELARRLSTESLLEKFQLIGGTALSIHLTHRLSEDLDFATPAQKLPKADISALLSQIKLEGKVIEDNTSVAARQNALNDGIDLEDYQQDWLVDGIKLTFFTLDQENGRDRLITDQGETWNEKLRLASLETLFVTKALVLTDRHTLRDNFDMQVLMTQGGFTYQDMVSAYETYRPNASLEIAESRLLSKDFPLTDPGLHELTEKPEKEIIDEIHDFFSQLIADRK